jgi:hypothetical protein
MHADQRVRVVVTLVGVALGVALHSPVSAQTPQASSETNPLFQRWVGRSLTNRPLFFDFYADTMLVVNDIYVSDFWYTPDSLVVFGDTTFTVRYEFRYDKMLIHTADGTTITMTPQSIAARPIFGGNAIEWGSWTATTNLGDNLLLQLRRASSQARWRTLPNGSWVVGDWDRQARNITFTWQPDSTTWIGQYDASGHQIIFEQTEPGTSVTIFRRYHRGR